MEIISQQICSSMQDIWEGINISNIGVHALKLHAVVEPCGSKDTGSAMTFQDQIMKADTLWALKTASENFSEYQMEYQSYFKRCFQTQQ